MACFGYGPYKGCLENHGTPSVEDTDTGSVQGRVWIGDKPAGNVCVQYARYFPEDKSSSTFSRIWTDSDGFFEVEDLPPGKYRFSREKKVESHIGGTDHTTYSGTHGVRVEIRPGETAEVKIGGEGRFVTGQLASEENADGESVSFPAMGDCYMYLVEEDSYPGHVLALDIEDDGSFEVPDVKPGSYLLLMRALSSSGPDRQVTPYPMSLEIPPGQDGERFDLGELKVKLLEKKPADKGTPLQYHDAIRQGDAQNIERLLSQTPALLETRNDQGETPLVTAARNGKREVVELLLEKGAEVNAVDESGKNAWYHAAFNGYQEIAHLLVEHGATWQTDGAPFEKREAFPEGVLLDVR
jgi:ankyrin repeat protein